jgi:hypothetical protein
MVAFKVITPSSSRVVPLVVGGKGFTKKFAFILELAVLQQLPVLVRALR